MVLQLFIIDYEVTDEDFDTHTTWVGIYNDLETAKNELRKIYSSKSDYKFFCYKIKIYQLINNEYKFTNKFYTYSFDKFTMFDYV
jgi:Zn-finger domain-containing protein